MRKSLSIVAAVVALSLLGACSSGGSDDAAKDTTTTVEKTTTTTTTPGVAVETWAEDFCGSLGTWLTDIQKASDAASDQAKVGDVDSLRQAVAKLYGTMSSATKTLMEDITSQGPPDIEDGEAFQAALLGKFQVVDQAALDTQEQIQALQGDIATVQTKIDELGTTFQKQVEGATSSFDDLGKKYPSSELSGAIEADCTF
ncbi:MAG: hypothetical protein ACTHN0_18095 [Aquihabitans sp.]